MKTDHESWHAQAFLQNRWTRKYRALIDAARAENRKRVRGDHHEHHIVPKSFYRDYCDDGWLDGDWDAPENRVLLTHHEHAQAHIWLWRYMTDGLARDKMAIAIKRTLAGLEARGRPYKVTVPLLARIMREASQAAGALSGKARLGGAKDRTVRIWQHENGRTFTGTRRAAEEWFGLRFGDLKPLTKKNAMLWAHRVRIVLPDQDLAQVERPHAQRGQRSTVVRTWAHLDGRTFTGTRYDAERHFGLETRALKSLVGKKPNRTCYGVWVVRPGDNPAKLPVPGEGWHVRDSIVRTWAHHDERIFTGTRGDAERHFGLRDLALHPLVRVSQRYQTSHGVRIINDDLTDDEEIVVP
jgi:hypothetical protein